jgi:hypothetical protein
LRDEDGSSPNTFKEGLGSNIAVVGDPPIADSLELVRSGSVSAAFVQGSVAIIAIGFDRAIRVGQKMSFDKRLTVKPIIVAQGTVGNYDLSGEFRPPDWKVVFSERRGGATGIGHLPDGE